jgi:hypothetical protein
MVRGVGCGAHGAERRMRGAGHRARGMVCRVRGAGRTAHGAGVGCVVELGVKV